MMDPEYVKIRFAFHSTLLDKWTIETMWATEVDKDRDYYQLDSIPFYATGVAFDDLIRAEYREETEQLQFIEVVKPSGHSTIQVFIMDSEFDSPALRKTFSDMGCDSENFDDHYFVLDVPPSINYNIVQSLLNNLQKEGSVDYAEACLSSVHYYE